LRGALDLCANLRFFRVIRVLFLLASAKADADNAEGTELRGALDLSANLRFFRVIRVLLLRASASPRLRVNQRAGL